MVKEKTSLENQQHAPAIPIRLVAQADGGQAKAPD